MISKVKNTIARLLYPYGSIRTVLSGPLRGYRYIVGPAMGVTYAVGASQDAQISFLLEKISDGEVVFDVGATKDSSLYCLRTLWERKGPSWLSSLSES